MRYLFAPLLVALSFLTLLPVGMSNPTDAEISRSRGWYPFVGLLYGLLLLFLALLWALALGLPLFMPALAALLLVTLAVGNRFLHLDGLMDFCDAMWAGTRWSAGWKSCAILGWVPSPWPVASACCW